MSDKIYFTNILIEQMQQIHMKCPALTKELNDRGFKCNTRQVQRYKNGEFVPSFEMAVEICHILHIPIPKSELEKILSDSREYTKVVRKTPSIKAQKVISLNLNEINLGPEIEVSDLLEIIDDRLQELYGEKAALNFYVAQLIEKDLKDKILRKGK